MKHSIGTFLYCEGKKREVFQVMGSGEEIGYEYYILKSLSCDTKSELLQSFVDEKFEVIHVSFFKKLYFKLFGLGKQRKN